MSQINSNINDNDKVNAQSKERPPANTPVNNISSSSQQNNNQKGHTKQIGHYILGKTLGEGTFGKVKLATHLLTGEKVAIKILEKDRIQDVSDVERVSREIHILKLLRHHNIVQLYEIIETPKQLFLIMEYCSGGELFDYIVSNTKIKEKEASKYFQQIISGVEYIHKLNIVHRDLKPENLLLSHNKSIKIVDFGLSNTYKKHELLKTACGSPCYAAPEMIAGKRYQGLNVDIWSCGVILYAMLCGYLPFEDPNTANLYKKILAGEYQIPKFVSTEAKDLIKCILNTDPTKRYTIQDIKNHQWFNLCKQVNISEGIIVGYNRIPIDQEILNQLDQFGFNLDYAQKCIDANKHNHITTTYYLLLKKHIQSGGKSVADISSEAFDAKLIIPYKRPSKTPNQNLNPNEIMNNSIMVNDEKENKENIKLNNEQIQTQPQPLRIDKKQFNSRRESEVKDIHIQVASTGGQSQKEQELINVNNQPQGNSSNITTNNNTSTTAATNATLAFQDLSQLETKINQTMIQQQQNMTNIQNTVNQAKQKQIQLMINQQHQIPQIIQQNNQNQIKARTTGGGGGLPIQTNQLVYNYNRDNFPNSTKQNNHQYSNSQSPCQQFKFNKLNETLKSEFNNYTNIKYPTNPTSHNVSPRNDKISNRRKMKFLEKKDQLQEYSMYSNDVSRDHSRNSSLGYNQVQNLNSIPQTRHQMGFLQQQHQQQGKIGLNKTNIQFYPSSKVRHGSQVPQDRNKMNSSAQKRERGKSTEPFDDANTSGYKIISNEAALNSSGIEQNCKAFLLNSTAYIANNNANHSNSKTGTNNNANVSFETKNQGVYQKSKPSHYNNIINYIERSRKANYSIQNDTLNNSFNLNITNYAQFSSTNKRSIH